jgi:hypothetical protein
MIGLQHCAADCSWVTDWWLGYETEQYFDDYVLLIYLRWSR